MPDSFFETYLDAWQRHHDGKASTQEAMVLGASADLVYEDVPTAMVFNGHDGVRAICGNSPAWVQEIRLVILRRQLHNDSWAIEWEARGIAKASQKPFVFRGSSLGSIDGDGKVNAH